MSIGKTMYVGFTRIDMFMFNSGFRSIKPGLCKSLALVVI